MGITDKITGRIKKAAGDLADDASLRRQGHDEERKGEAKDELARSREKSTGRRKRSLTSSAGRERPVLRRLSRGGAARGRPERHS